MLKLPTNYRYEKMKSLYFKYGDFYFLHRTSGTEIPYKNIGISIFLIMEVVVV